MGRFSTFGMVGALCLFLAGCSSGPSDPSAATKPATTEQPVASSVKQVHVTKVDFGDNWPLTVDEATIVNDNDAVYLQIHGTNYATNGFARGLAAKDGTPDIEKSPYLNQDKTIYLSGIIKRGLALNSH